MSTSDLAKRLAEVSAPEGALTLYVNLDAALYPTPWAREAEFDALLSEAHRAYAHADLGHFERVARSDQLARARDWLRTRTALAGSGSAAIFCAADGVQVFEAVALDRYVKQMVVVDDTFHLEPLLGAETSDRWCVLLVNKRTARVLYGTAHHIRQIKRFAVDVLPHHKQGGWRQAALQRHAESEAHMHVRRSLSVVTDIHRRVGFEALLVAAPEEVWPYVEDMPAELRERLAGKLSLDVEHATPHDVLEHARAAFAEAAERNVHGLLGMITEQGGTGQTAIGLRDVLEALRERRVHTLVIEDNLDRPGVRCPSCGWTGPVGATCPYDATATAPARNVAAEAVRLALLQDAAVITFPPDTTSRPADGIAAVLRYAA